jgi:3-oxosteroid 1-dehydrogenase
MSETYDVVVLGSGAAGLTAAFTAAKEGARVGLFEKSDKYGGTTAWSGGHIWIANNPLMATVGATDSEEEAMTYVMSLGRGVLDENLARAYVHNGPKMVKYLDEYAHTGFYVCKGFPDYHPENPGGKPGGGRTIETGLYAFDELGEWADKITEGPYLSSYLVMTETPLGSAVPQPPSAAEIQRRSIRKERGLGQGLVGRLLRACLDEGVELTLSHRATEFVLEGGRAVGVNFDSSDGIRTVHATKGVVLATGGFEWNEEYKAAFLRGTLALPVSPPSNTGDGLAMAMKAGAALQNMREAFWAPVAALPEGVNRMNRVMINADRTRPRSIIVNRKGRRFTNEASSYNAIGGSFHQEDTTAFEYANLPSWLVFDQQYLERFGSIGHPYAGETFPWLIEAKTLPALAEKLGIAVDEFTATVERWNANVADGSDPDFHRGESAHDLWWGDPFKKGTIEGTLGPIDEGPFYAIELNIGALGTKGGPKVDAHAQVVNIDGNLIPGLYAAGNVSSPTGMAYTGAGGTLGPAMVFGWLAGQSVTRS